MTDGRRRRRVTDQRILEAAAAEFATSGFAGASMAAVAERAGTTKPTLYANVGTKDDLYAATLAAESAALRELLLSTYAGTETAPVREQVRAGTRAIFRFAAQRPDGFALLFSGSPGLPLGADTTRAAHEDVLAAVTGLVERGLGERAVEPGTARLLASMTVGALHAAAREAVTAGLDLDAAADLAEAWVMASFTRLDLGVGSEARAAR